MCHLKIYLSWLLFVMFLIKLVLSSSGPMARDVDSLALCMQALLCDHLFTLDPTVPPLPFNVQVCPLQKMKKLQFSVFPGMCQTFLPWTSNLLESVLVALQQVPVKKLFKIWNDVSYQILVRNLL